MVQKFVILRATRLKILLLLAIYVAPGIRVQAQEDIFNRTVSQYEGKMDDAAKSWLNKDYGRALDSFYSANAFLSKNKPLPSDVYAWTGCRALKTYAVVLARMVEFDLYLNQDQNELVDEVAKQVMNWSEILKEQVYQWAQVETHSEADSLLRIRWTKRFHSAILRARKISKL